VIGQGFLHYICVRAVQIDLFLTFSGTITAMSTEQCATAFLSRVLDPPAYGFANKDGTLYVPTHKEIFREFFSRLNIFKTKKNWLPFASWTAVIGLSAFCITFMVHAFSWPLFFIGLTYAMVALGTHGTIYLHRYSTHRAYTFKNGFWRFICRNLSIKVIPEEIYVISHHVHHSISEEPGDPYNPLAGWLYCFLADVNHQTIAKDLSETDYNRLACLMKHTGVQTNTYAQYQKWGSLAHPARTAFHYVVNWGMWFGIFYLIGGAPLALAIFGMSAVWAFGVRTFNFDGHGGGKDKRQDGIDFHRKDLSINQVWPGYVAGEWHNNHHLYPNGARSGFLPYQLDLAWIFIKSWHSLGAISTFRDYKAEFITNYYGPYQKLLREKAEAATSTEPQLFSSESEVSPASNI
jgi:fatty-acid desaturase